MSEALTWLTGWELRELIGKREVSPVEVTEHFLRRIDELDPLLHAMRHVDKEGALRQARAAEPAVLEGGALGLLHGVPIAVKEHIAVEGLPSMFGPASQCDDIGVERLRAAGAIVVGTTKMPGMGSVGLFGGAGESLEDHPRNPWDTTKVPGSSSAGSAAAVAAAMLPLAIGSDGGGSTRLPAAFCGIVGLHPTVGRIPFVDYQMPRLALTITIGPLCRDARDAATVLQVMAGPDGRDFGCLQSDPPRYVAALDEGIEGLRLTWTDDFGYAGRYAGEESPRVIAAVRRAADGLRARGATLEPTSEPWEDFWPGYMITGRALKDGPMAFGGHAPPTPAEYRAAAETRARNRERFARLFAGHDALLSVTSQRVTRSVEEWHANWNARGETFPHGTYAPTYTSHTHMFNWLGWPAISVPCGFVDGLPIGLQIIGRPDREDVVLRLAHAFVDAFPRAERPAAVSS
ncbi:MAG: amidase [Myxococcota bacterium]